MAAGKILKHIMVDMIYRTSNNQITLMDKLLEARTEVAILFRTHNLKYF